MPNQKAHSLGKVAVQHLHEGMAPYLNEELNFYSPKFVRSIRPAPYLITQDEQYYWIVHAASSTMRVLRKDSGFVVGVAVVWAHGVELSVFTKNYQLAKEVNRIGAVASYMLCATSTPDDVWVLKVAQEF
jgi:hypothetical protein